jgi:preprotein translocase subunit SecB
LIIKKKEFSPNGVFMSKTSEVKLLGFDLRDLKYTLNEIEKSDEKQLQIEINLPETNTADLSVVQLIVNVSSKLSTANIIIDGRFKFADEIDDNSRTVFLNTNGAAILYPYARALLVSISNIGSIDPILLPVLNFERMYRLKIEESDSSKPNP